MQIKQLSWQEVLPIRHQVLWPDKSLGFCHVQGDKEATHYGVFDAKKLISVASVYADPDVYHARLRKFATLEQYQGQGVGSQLLTYIIAEARRTAAREFWCDARSSVIGLYEKFGMTIEGGELIKSGLPYMKMRLKL